jgi:Yip1 domain
MSETNSSSDSQQSVSSKPFLARLMGVFIDPAETFNDIARNPDFISPFILLVLGSIAFSETMLAKIGIGRIILQALKGSGRAAAMDPAQLDLAIQRGAQVGKIAVQAAAVVGVPIFLLIVAGFGLLVLNGFFGEKAGFKQVFSVTCYADMPALLGLVMAIAVVLFGDPDSFNPRSPAPTSLGFFLDPLTTSHAILALADSLDFIIVWFLILIAMGLSRVAQKRVKSGSIFMVFLGAWVLLIIAKVGFAVLAG